MATDVITTDSPLNRSSSSTPCRHGVMPGVEGKASTQLLEQFSTSSGSDASTGSRALWSELVGVPNWCGVPWRRRGRW